MVDSKLRNVSFRIFFLDTSMPSIYTSLSFPAIFLLDSRLSITFHSDGVKFLRKPHFFIWRSYRALLNRLLASSFSIRNGSSRFYKVVGACHNFDDFFELLAFHHVQISYYAFFVVPFRFSCGLTGRHCG